MTIYEIGAHDSYDDRWKALNKRGGASVPSVGDTVHVEGEDRRVRQVYRHHTGDTCTWRVAIDDWDE